MANPRDIKKIPITWTGNLSQAIKADDFRNIGLTIVGTGDVPVDFSVASTISNAFAALILADETSTTYSTTLSVSGSTKLAEVNTNLATFICVSRSADTVDAYITVTDNQ